MSKAEERAKEYYQFCVITPEKYREYLGFIKGYNQAVKDLGWHSVDESLPPVDEEVIVLTDHLNLGCFHKIGFAHIVNQEATVDIDGKPYKPISHNGWNIPGVDYWMPMPKLKEKEK